MNAERVTFSVLDLLKALWPNEYYTLWFMKEIIIYIIACPLIYIVFKNKYVGVTIIVMLLINAELRFVNIPFHGILYYSAGAYIALNYKGIEYYKSKVFSILAIAFLIFILVHNFNMLGNMGFNLLFFIAVWFALDVLPLNRQYPWWMKITFFTYVSHDIFLEAYEKIVFVLFGNRTIFALLDYIFVPCAVFCTLIIIAAFLRRYLPTIWKMCTGMR